MAVTRARRILIIKAVHSIAFWWMLACFVYNVYAAATATFTWVLAVTYGTHLIEGVVLIFNRWTCPLRIMAEKAGAENGQITDIFLPKWLADHLFQIGKGLFVVETLWLAISFINH
ncbi:hypothetical protein [Dehalogenimonas etheniformans]|uniref:DUF2784 family protein n=1 Tax=Dehalogenimonas etheniformans TaxID=1536648 RepID=A0A2P5P798_9CHLR|nr:hypothetical protein [Dehalogenimonas etheniformans]PPD58177.1 hypothetical protein JP09_005135 [Dehalogenimonas etheniformans]QNT75587.1 hypothetical protein HX448_02235 [Dehalogenimonas etheniformans]